MRSEIISNLAPGTEFSTSKDKSMDCIRLDDTHVDRMMTTKSGGGLGHFWYVQKATGRITSTSLDIQVWVR